MTLLLALGSLAEVRAQSIVHLCDCDTTGPVQPHAACIAGADQNSGTAAQPKRTLAGSGVNPSSAPGGSEIRYCEGGAWNHATIFIENNPNTDAANPLSFTSYAPPTGAAGQPALNINTDSPAVVFCCFQDTVYDGGYAFRNLRFQGPGANSRNAGLFFVSAYVTDVSFDNVRVEGFAIGVQGATERTGNPGSSLRRVTVTNSLIARNHAMGLLIAGDDLRIEGNLIEANNFSGSSFNHGLYIGASRSASRVTVRNNRFVDNSLVGGRCEGGNLTVHGQTDQLLIEHNLIAVPQATGGCYGISLTDGGVDYVDFPTGGPEFNRRLVVRSNTIVNVGQNFLTVQSAVAPIIENNRLISTTATSAYGIVVENGGAEDEPGNAARIRNNTCWFERNTASSTCIALRNGGANVLANNVAWFGPTASPTVRGFEHGAAAAWAHFDHNHVRFGSGSGNYTATHATLAQAQMAGIGLADSSGDPRFAAAPAAGNAYSLAVLADSPLRSSGSDAHMAPRDVLDCVRDATPDKGAHEFGATPCGVASDVLFADGFE